MSKQATCQKERLCETCNSTKHRTARCNQTLKNDVLAQTIMSGNNSYNDCRLIHTLDRVQRKALLAAMISRVKENGVECKPHKPVAKMTNGQLAFDCIMGYKLLRQIDRDLVRANIEACPICMENLEQTDAKCTLKCGHSLHTKCYSNMLAHNCNRRGETTCPLCRQAAF